MFITVPDSLIAHRFDKTLHVRLSVVLIVELDQFGVNGRHGHEHVNRGSLGAQQHLPHLRTRTGRRTDKQNVLLKEGGREDKQRLKESSERIQQGVKNYIIVFTVIVPQKKTPNIVFYLM